MMFTLKVNNVDKTSEIYKWSATHNTIEGHCTINAQTRYGTSLTWVEGQTVLIYTDDNVVQFYGVIRSISIPSDNMATREWTVNCDDVRSQYQTITVNETLTDTTTVHEALSRLITNYTSDYFGTDSTDQNAYCQFNLSGSLSNAIATCLGTLEVPCHWEIRYDIATNKVYHDFVKSYNTKLGTLAHPDLATGEFAINTQDIKNELTVYSSEVVWADPDYQYYFYDRSYSTVSKKTNRLMVALKRKPQNWQAFLLIGKKSSDYGQMMRAVKIRWDNVVGETDADGALIGFDPKVLLKGGYYTTGNYGYTSTGTAVESSQLDWQASVVKTQEIKDKLLQKLIPNSSITLQSAAQDGAPYGVCHIPDYRWIISNISIVSSVAGFMIDPDDVLGFVFTSTIKDVKKITMPDNSTGMAPVRASQATYGVKPATTEELKTTSLTMLDAYARAKMLYYAEARLSGQVKIIIRENGITNETFYPKPGYLYDLTNTFRPSQTDIRAQEVVTEYENNILTSTVSANKTGRADMLLWVANMLKRKAEKTSVTTVAATTAISFEGSLTWSGDLVVTTVDSDDYFKFDQPLERMWFY